MGGGDGGREEIPQLKEVGHLPSELPCQSLVNSITFSERVIMMFT